MIFYRAETGPRDLSVSALRLLTAASLTSYPAGAAILAFGPNTMVNSVIGFGLILVALVCYAPLVGSSIQRIVGEETKKLDEYELRLRGKAMSLTYAIFTVLVLLSVLYSAIAADKGSWFPSTYEEFNGIFWGVFLYASILPAAVLCWIIDPSFDEER